MLTLRARARALPLPPLPPLPLSPSALSPPPAIYPAVSDGYLEGPVKLLVLHPEALERLVSHQVRKDLHTKAAR